MANLADTLNELGLSPQEIADRARLPLVRVNALLCGENVTPGELRALARGLRLPVRAFSQSGLLSSSATSSVRFRNTRSKKEYDPTNERVSAFVDTALKILPRRNEPPEWLKFFWQKKLISYDDAEVSAQKFRSLLYPDRYDEPAIGLPQRLDALDGIVVSQLLNSKFEGASVVASGYAFIFVSPRFSGRMLFTMGHELGHVIANHAAEIPHYDLAGDVGRFANSDESFADAFSSAFLLPMHALGVALLDIRKFIGAKSDSIGDVEIIFLSRFFGVSFDVASRRCERLGLLPPGGAFSLSAYLKDEFGSAEKRAEQLKLPERQAIRMEQVSPSLIKCASKQLMSGTISPTWLAERLGISIDQLQIASMRLSGRSSVAH